MSARLCWVWLAVWLAVVGCDRKTEPFEPGERPRQPDLSRIFPAPEDEAPPAGPMAARPSPAATPAAEAPAGRPGAAVRGTVHLADTAKGRRGTLFIIARPEGVSGGPPLAVLRVAEPAFPQAFEIGPANVMVPSMKFEGRLVLTARLDADGNAMTRDPADPVATSAQAIVPGTLGVELVLQ